VRLRAIWFNRPMFGLAMRIHEMAISMPGTTMRPISTRLMNFASGVLVRSTTQATKAPSTKATRVEATEKASVSQVALQNDHWPKARS